MCQKSDTICIKQHRLDITIDPGVRMWITDTLLVDVDDPLGFWATLNSKAKVTKVLLQGEEIDFTFRGGLLSVNQTDIRNGELVINYSLSREADLLASKFGESLNSYFGAVQSTLLKGDYQQTYGDSTVRVFWRTRRESYLSNSDGKTALWSDSYGSIFYNKGPWVLKILRDQLGEKTFEAGFKNYIQNTITPDKDIYAFAKSMSAAAGFDVWPMLETWLKSKHIPEVKAWVQDGHLVIEQTGDDVFQFPLEVVLITQSRIRTQRYTIEERKSRFPIENSEEITDVQVDPNDEMLLTVLE